MQINIKISSFNFFLIFLMMFAVALLLIVTTTTSGEVTESVLLHTTDQIHTALVPGF